VLKSKEAWKKASNNCAFSFYNNQAFIATFNGFW